MGKSSKACEIVDVKAPRLEKLGIEKRVGYNPFEKEHFVEYYVDSEILHPENNDFSINTRLPYQIISALEDDISSGDFEGIYISVSGDHVDNLEFAAQMFRNDAHMAVSMNLSGRSMFRNVMGVAAGYVIPKLLRITKLLRTN